ncbi:MAG: GIY-YIG nuclease family protein [Ruminiclostridium sp.]|nr:GIY-YIG nuclease family protein [Ruminiclostridium sp.]
MVDLSFFSDEDLIGLFNLNVENELKKRGYSYGWYKKDSFVGAIYILVNPAFPDLVKIGYADDVQKRLKALNRNSGLPDPFHCYAIYRVKKRLEDLKLHSLIDALDSSLRHSRNREFYEMNYKKAYDILSAIAQINGGEEQLRKNPFSDSYFESLSMDFDTNSDNRQSKATIQDRLTFSMIGIPVGSSLVFTKDDTIVCVTKDEINQVEYNGKTYSISKLAAILLNVKAARGGLFFNYKGETLNDIRKKLGL